MGTEHAAGRGAHLVDAALAILADEGLGALSMRTVAARAGVSPAQVQYYFRTKAELVDAAFEHASTGFLDDLATVPGEGPSAERLRAIVWRWLPLDADRQRRARVWLAYSAAAATDERRAADAARLDAELRAWFGRQLATLADRGAADAAADPDEAAARLLAIIDGLTTHLLMLPPEARPALAERVLGGWLDRLLGDRVPLTGPSGADR